MTSYRRKLWIGLLIMALLTPVGIILPKRFNAGDAWGEWGTGTIEKLLGYVPEGLKRLADIWKAPISGYSFGDEGSSLAVRIISYIISGIIGILIAALVVYIISRFLVKHER
jgi:cobalt/nickel transport protein